MSFLLKLLAPMVQLISTLMSFRLGSSQNPDGHGSSKAPVLDSLGRKKRAETAEMMPPSRCSRHGSTRKMADLAKRWGSPTAR